MLFSIEREVMGPFSFGRASAFYTSVHYLSPHMRDSLRKRTLWIKDTASSEKEAYLIVTSPDLSTC